MAREQTAGVFVFARSHNVSWVWRNICSIYCAQGQVYTRTRPPKLFKLVFLASLPPKCDYRFT
jgi:hypothetical protein